VRQRKPEIAVLLAIASSGGQLAALSAYLSSPCEDNL
jgi:hypothetical protein